VLETQRRINELYARHCGHSLAEVEQALDRDTFMSADEALAWGLVDRVQGARDIAA
jgi:ATP-dependent Clp protease protease subunit